MLIRTTLHVPPPLLPPCVARRRRSQQSCCGAVYIPLDPAPPSQLAPWEWNGWLEMCKGAGDIETALSECCGRAGQGRRGRRQASSPVALRCRPNSMMACGAAECVASSASSTPCALSCPPSPCREAGAHQDRGPGDGGAAPGGECCAQDGHAPTCASAQTQQHVVGLHGLVFQCRLPCACTLGNCRRRPAPTSTWLCPSSATPTSA